MANFYDLPPEVVLKNTKTKSMLTALQQQLIATITYSLTKTLKNISKIRKYYSLNENGRNLRNLSRKKMFKQICLR